MSRVPAALLSLLFCSVVHASAIVEYPLPAYGSREPLGLAKGSDGNVWFSFMDARELVRIAPDGTLT